MAIADCSKEMNRYHKEEVNLRKAQQDEMRDRRNAGRTRLKRGLESDKDPLPKEMASQGSYAMRTMVQDEQCEYDIDDGVYFWKDDLKTTDGKELTPYEARSRVCKALKKDNRLKHDAEIHKNCVRQIYPEGYHIDLPVYRVISSQDDEGNETLEYELASGDNWTKSDARAVTRWFKDIVGSLKSGEDDRVQMRRVVRFTKKFIRSRKSWKAKATSGICITVLVKECFVAQLDRDDHALYKTWDAIDTRLDKSLRINHPVEVDRILADEGDIKISFFHSRLKDALQKIKEQENANGTKQEWLKVWDKVFDTTFFSAQLDEDSSAKKTEHSLAPSLLRPAAVSSAFTFPNKPIVPNKPAGFA